MQLLNRHNNKNNQQLMIPRLSLPHRHRHRPKLRHKPKHRLRLKLPPPLLSRKQKLKSLIPPMLTPPLLWPWLPRSYSQQRSHGPK